MSEKEINQDQQHQRDASAQGVNRRECVGASAGVAGAAVVGASVLGAASKAAAQDAEPGKFSTPDWKTLKPGAKDSDMYTEETGFDENNPDMTWWPGRNISGVTIGLVQMRANLPMMPGNMGNASTFDFPMLYREINVDNAMDVMEPKTTKNFTDGIVEAAKWLELQGVSAIMANCGFFAHYQKVVQERIDTSFFSSSKSFHNSLFPFLIIPDTTSLKVSTKHCFLLFLIRKRVLSKRHLYKLRCLLC